MVTVITVRVEWDGTHENELGTRQGSMMIGDSEYNTTFSVYLKEDIHSTWRMHCQVQPLQELSAAVQAHSLVPISQVRKLRLGSSLLGATFSWRGGW